MKRTILLLVFFLISSFLLKAQEEFIQFQSDSFLLNGTLHIPSGSTVKVPAVILVHGSGPNDRNQSFAVNNTDIICLYPGLANKTLRSFKDISDALASEGIAVLRYDKSTFTHGASIHAESFTLHHLEADIISAYNYLLSRTEIDANAIFLAGHSKGASQIVRISSKLSIAGMISLAGAYYPVDAILPDQIRYVANNCGDSATGENQAQQIIAAFSAIRNGTWPANTPLMGGYLPYWHSWLGLGDSIIHYFNTTNIPTLFIQGSDDYNVTPANYYQFQNQLIGSRFSYSYFDGINHHLTEANNEKVPAYITTTISNWILNRYSEINSIDENERNQLTINLISRSHTIELVSENIEKVECVQLYNLQGKMVYSSAAAQLPMQINTQAFANGLYIVKARLGNAIYSAKVIID